VALRGGAGAARARARLRPAQKDIGAADRRRARAALVERSRSAPSDRRILGQDPYGRRMKIIVYLGTGGVGKTSTAAATALAEARAGAKSLVLTIDPALRLRTTLRLKEGVLEQLVPLDPPAKGELWAALLNVRATLDDAVRLYGKSSTVDRILKHPIYATIADSLVGMQELMAVERIDQLTRRGFEHIVVDTAPSRHALEFLDKPLFFSDLAGSGWVKAVGRTYKFVAGTGMMTLGRKTIDLYARAESILGANLVRQILDFYSLFVSIAEGYAERAEKTVAML